MTIQLRFDALTCCMFVDIINTSYSVNSSHVTFRTHFLLGTTAVRYSLLLIMNSTDPSYHGCSLCMKCRKP